MSQLTVCGSAGGRSLSEGWSEKCASSEMELSKFSLNGILASRSWICKTREDVKCWDYNQDRDWAAMCHVWLPVCMFRFQPNCNSLCDWLTNFQLKWRKSSEKSAAGVFGVWSKHGTWFTACSVQYNISYRIDYNFLRSNLYVIVN